MLTVDANVWVAAFDPRDGFHRSSVVFLDAAIDLGEGFLAPAFLPVEVGCAVARRFGDADQGVRAGEALLGNPALVLDALTPDFLEAAVRLGTMLRLRAADALYAAVAQRSGTRLVTWDRELVQRASGLTPDDWLAEQQPGN